MGTPHVHKNRDDLDRRVEDFGSASLSVQRAALAELRREASERPGASYLALLAIVIPFIFALQPGVEITNPWAAAVVGIVFVLFVGLIIAVMERIISRGQRTSIMWLAAYEDEIDRRRSMRGAEGRRWRREH